MALLVLLASTSAWVGCAGVTSTPTSVPAGSPSAPPAQPEAAPSADQRAALPAALAAERRWLQSWFEGTPVVIAQDKDGRLGIEVPREFSFDPGKSQVKPALAAVLNKVAESMRRVPLARISLLAAPEDASAGPGLAAQRAAQVQRQLIAAGVPAARLAKPSVSAGAAVQLRLELVSP